MSAILTWKLQSKSKCCRIFHFFCTLKTSFFFNSVSGLFKLLFIANLWVVRKKISMPPARIFWKMNFLVFWPKSRFQTFVSHFFRTSDLFSIKASSDINNSLYVQFLVVQGKNRYFKHKFFSFFLLQWIDFQIWYWSTWRTLLCAYYELLRKKPFMARACI